jgi:hypothetical protein
MRLAFLEYTPYGPVHGRVPERESTALAERMIVDLGVVGSSPTSHPNVMSQDMVDTVLKHVAGSQLEGSASPW